MPALGERFRAAREARGLTLSDVAEQIRIRSVYLAAIEDENWSAIGATVYIRGFLRTYARFLGLDPEENVAAFNGEAAQASAPQPATPGTSYRVDTAAPVRNLSPLIWLASLVAVALIAFVVYNEATFRQAPPVAVASASVAPAVPAAATDGSPAASPSQAATPSPAASVTPSLAAAAPETARSLEVHLSAPSWVRVTVDGNVSMEGTFPAGTDRVFHGKTARLRIGNAGGVEVVVDGKNLGTLGAVGNVVERSFVL